MAETISMTTRDIMAAMPGDDGDDDEDDEDDDGLKLSRAGDCGK